MMPVATAAATMMSVMDAPKHGTVLVVDDEATIVEVVGRYLERAGYRVVTAADGPNAISAVAEHRPDLVVLDIMLPEMNGLDVMRILGEQTDEPEPAVILLTSKSEESDRIVGLRRGADDYVVKPFSPAELVARVDSVLRRIRKGVDGPGERPAPIRHGELTIDQAGRRVTLAEAEVSLTQLEFDLLAFLAINAGQVFSRDQLMEQVWGRPDFRDSGTVTVHVRRLRAKLESDPGATPHIETVWGVGYRFRI